MPECYADTLLIETLVPTKSGYNHQHSCFQVEREMRFGKLKDQFAVGIIDKDKEAIKYLNEFEEIGKVTGSLILWKHKKDEKHHYIIQICPALEKWILEICEAEAIDIAEFGLSSDLKELTQKTKSRSSMENQQLKDLFRNISLKDGNLSVQKLKGWVKYLKEKNYKADIKALQNG